MLVISVILPILLVTKTLSSEELHKVPFGKSVQYLIMNKNGAYEYGYNTGDGQLAIQQANENNNVHGRYAYKYLPGTEVNVAYSSGVHGGLKSISQTQNNHLLSNYASSWYPNKNTNMEDKIGHSKINEKFPMSAIVLDNPDASYSFRFATKDQSRDEVSDQHGNTRGQFSYTDNAGKHDLAYIAGSHIGFVPIGGSLATPNGLVEKSTLDLVKNKEFVVNKMQPILASLAQAPNKDALQLQKQTDQESNKSDEDDGSYRPEKYGDNEGQYVEDNSGQYVDGDMRNQTTDVEPLKTLGKIVTPPDSQPNIIVIPSGGFSKQPPPTDPSSSGIVPYSPPSITDSEYVALRSKNTPTDGSYQFFINTDNYKRQEEAEGPFSYKNSAATHDLSFLAGFETGLKTSSGSLASVPGIITQPQFGLVSNFQSSGKGLLKHVLIQPTTVDVKIPLPLKVFTYVPKVPESAYDTVC